MCLITCQSRKCGCETDSSLHQWFQKNNIWMTTGPCVIYLFKVITRDTRTMCETCLKLIIKKTRTISLTSFWCFYFWFWTNFTHWGSVSIINFEQVNTGWLGATGFKVTLNCGPFSILQCSISQSIPHKLPNLFK